MKVRYIVVLVLVAVLVALAVVVQRTLVPTDRDPVATFVKKYWHRPVLAQGGTPPGYAQKGATPDYLALETSLDTAACAKCHPVQYQDWSKSLHSHAMGAGILWQLQVLPAKQVLSCLNCHAPLAEQKTLLAQKLGWPGIAQNQPPPYVPQDLYRQGVICAACHVRQQRHYGPPPRAGIPSGDTAGLPHGGYSAQLAFTDSRFCASCHQFPKDGPSLNGKLLENTYAEWLASPYAAEGKSCQSCHMPQRQHLWRGIHDPAMVRQALSVNLDVTIINADRLQVRARLRNSGAGHYFPTYLVPEVDVSLVLLDPQGRVRKQLAKAVISRDVNIALTRERKDTRLPPGGSLNLKAQLDRPVKAGWQVELRVDVAPEEHYEHMFESVLQDQADALPASVRHTLETALAKIRTSHFNALQVKRSIPPAAIAN